MAILHFIHYLARQGIPLRGHGSDEDSNFFQLLMMKSKEFPELKAQLEKKHGKFVTHDVQNEIITIMSNSVLQSLLKKIAGNSYSTVCDEYTDCSNPEQLTFAGWRPLKHTRHLLVFTKYQTLKARQLSQ